MSEMLDGLFEEIETEEELRIPEEYERFTVDSDQKAEWCLDKIREARADEKKWLEFYAEQAEKVKKTRERREEFFKSLLQHYFLNVPHKETKTQSSYQLPSGKLVVKKQGPEIVRDDAQVIAWLKENCEGAHVKTKEALDWAEMKKNVVFMGGHAVNGDGEIIPGITVTARPDKFKVEVK